MPFSASLFLEDRMLQDCKGLTFQTHVWCVKTGVERSASYSMVVLLMHGSHDHWLDNCHHLCECHQFCFKDTQPWGKISKPAPVQSRLKGRASGSEQPRSTVSTHGNPCGNHVVCDVTTGPPMSRTQGPPVQDSSHGTPSMGPPSTLCYGTSCWSCTLCTQCGRVGYRLQC